ncbi:MAG: hypothetical protein KatS3mg107_0695 [Gemmataceae bacterium]|nr:MAG: hypothetical protein KatS3mg107_0695 [Gemmataceae bacterium]
MRSQVKTGRAGYSRSFQHGQRLWSRLCLFFCFRKQLPAQSLSPTEVSRIQRKERTGADGASDAKCWHHGGQALQAGDESAILWLTTADGNKDRGGRTVRIPNLEIRKLAMITMRRFLGTVGLGIVVLLPVGSAQAQQPAPGIIPQPMPAGIPHNTAPTSATPVPVAVQSLPAVPAAQAGAISTPPRPVVNGGNVSVLGTSSGAACNGGPGTALGAGKAHIQFGQYGRQCANGCGSWAGNCGFIFGSCRSFFDPCGPLPLGCKKCPDFSFWPSVRHGRQSLHLRFVSQPLTRP